MIGDLLESRRATKGELLYNQSGIMIQLIRNSHSEFHWSARRTLPGGAAQIEMLRVHHPMK